MIGTFKIRFSNHWKICAAAAVLAVPAAFGQSPAEFQHIAETNNPALAAARSTWDAMRTKVAAARSLPDPMAGVDMERANTTISDYDDFEFMVSQDLPGWGKRDARARVATLEAEVAGFTYIENVRDVRRRTARAWWDLWLVENRIGIAREQTNLLASVESAIRARMQSGQGQPNDLIRAQVESSRSANNVATLIAQRDAALVRLNALVNRPTDTAVVLPKEPPLPQVAGDWATLEARARKYCCILVGAQREILARGAAVRAARIERRPDYQFRVEARQFNGGGTIDEYDTGIFVNLPWLWRGKYDAAEAEAQAARAGAESTAEQRLNETLAELREQYVMVENARRSVDLYTRDILPQADRMIANMRASYGSGMMTLRDLIDALRDVREARDAWLMACAELGSAYADLESNIQPWTEFERSTGLIPADME
jgi:outer membrane protein TolC